MNASFDWELWEFRPGNWKVRVDAWMTFDAALYELRRLEATAGASFDYDIHRASAGTWGRRLADHGLEAGR